MDNLRFSNEIDYTTDLVAIPLLHLLGLTQNQTNRQLLPSLTNLIDLITTVATAPAPSHR